MYNAVIRKNLIQIDIQTLANSCWKAWDLGLTEHDQIVKVWNILFECFGVKVNEDSLIGWEKEDYVPYLPKTYNCDFQFPDYYDYQDIFSLTIVSELLNNNHPESEWKQMLSNYLTWLGYEQK